MGMLPVPGSVWLAGLALAGAGLGGLASLCVVCPPLAARLGALVAVVGKSGVASRELPSVGWDLWLVPAWCGTGRWPRRHGLWWLVRWRRGAP